MGVSGFIPKLLFILWSSKTHGLGDKPQTVKIVGSTFESDDQLCPFKALTEYLGIRRKYKTEDEPFFVFSDHSPITATIYRKVLKDLITMNRLDCTKYRVNGMCAGRTSDLLQMGVLVETVAISVKMSRCQDDIFPRIELIPSFVLSSDNTNCKNDIQLFHQLFDELSVHTDYH